MTLVKKRIKTQQRRTTARFRRIAPRGRRATNIGADEGIRVGWNAQHAFRVNSMPHHEAKELAEQLSKLHNVHVETVLTNDDLYSLETLTRTARDRVYFISEEDSQQSARTADYLIRYNKVRYELANTARVEHATEPAVKLNSVIDQIKDKYSVEHQGQKPSLHKIASILNNENIKSPGGKGKWIAATVKRIMEKSAGENQQSV